MKKTKYQIAIEELRDMINNGGSLAEGDEIANTLEELVKLNTPKKPIYTDYGYDDDDHNLACECWICGENLDADDSFCRSCGQAIKW